MVTSVLLRVGGGVPSVRRVVLCGGALWRGRLPVTQASGRASRVPPAGGALGESLRGQPTYERSLHAGRPDTFNV